MIRERIALFAVIALIIGMLLPMLLQYSYLTPAPMTTTTTSRTTSGNRLKPAIQSPPINMSVFENFENYTELINYLSAFISVSENTYYPYLIREMPVLTVTIPTVTAARTGEQASAGHAGVSTRYSETNIQVQGVDEPDIVKTNGRIIAVLLPEKTVLVDALSQKVVSIIESDNENYGLFLYKQVLIIIGMKGYSPKPILLGQLEKTLVSPDQVTDVRVYNISDPSSPYLIYNVSISGRIIGARLINDTVYVISQHSAYMDQPLVPLINDNPLSPDRIYVTDIPPSYYTNILALNITSGHYNVESFLTGPTTWIYMSHKHLIIASHTYSMLKNAETVVDIIKKYVPENVSSQLDDALKSGRLYELNMILSNYLNTLSPEQAYEVLNRVNNDLRSKTLTEYTTVYVLDVQGLNLSYRGKIDVPGRILDQFSIEEYRGKYLVIATTVDEYNYYYDYRTINYSPQTYTVIIKDSSGEKTYTITIKNQVSTRGFAILTRTTLIRYNQLTIYDLESMNKTSEIKGIAENEHIRASRLVGDLFILVTYRTIDPLFAINISNPYKPEILGFLEIPGYNEYLHPISNDVIMGLGVDGSDLVISLYNISNPRNIVEISKATLSNMRSIALSDYHAFTIDPEKKLVLIPLSRGGYGYGWDTLSVGIAVISYENYELEVVKIIQQEEASRALYIDDKLYTVSPLLIMVYDENTLEELGRIPLV